MGEIERGLVGRNGTKVYYEMMGGGDPLVLIHGGYMDRRMWDDQLVVFAQDYRVIRYDVRGFGKSELPQVPSADRQDLASLLAFLGIEKTYLLGLSLGGVIALDFTLDYPDMVEALILVGSPIPGFPYELLFTEEHLQQELERRKPFNQAIQEKNISPMVITLMKNSTLFPPPHNPSARQRVRAYLSEYSFAWVLYPAQRQELDPPAYERLGESHVPTLIIVAA